MLNKFLLAALAAFLFIAPANMARASDALTVENVVVDKTAENAVVARDLAIQEAKRLAFQQLAERNLSADEFTRFVMPENGVIATLVQDFSIADEQLSATRYVAKFTVRFQNAVKNYINIRPAAITDTVRHDGETVLPRAILVLPYFETAEGKALLWEDANPWRKTWQDNPPEIFGWQISVPLGDINDIAVGPVDAVWSGEYGPVEKLRQMYNADEVILAIINLAGPAMVVDVYSYRDGSLKRLASLTPYGDGTSREKDMMQAMQDVVAFLQKPAADTTAAAPASGGAQKGSGQKSIDAEMRFDNFAQWMEAQKRISTMTPPVRLELKTLSSSSAAFSLTFAGDFDMLQSALASQGLALGQPTIEVGEAVFGSVQDTQTPIYDLKLVN